MELELAIVAGNWHPESPLQIARATELRGKRLDDSVLAQALDPPVAGLLESKT